MEAHQRSSAAAVSAHEHLHAPRRLGCGRWVGRRDGRRDSKRHGRRIRALERVAPLHPALRLRLWVLSVRDLTDLTDLTDRGLGRGAAPLSAALHLRLWVRALGRGTAAPLERQQARQLPEPRDARPPDQALQISTAEIELVLRQPASTHTTCACAPCSLHAHVMHVSRGHSGVPVYAALFL